MVMTPGVFCYALLFEKGATYVCCRFVGGELNTCYNAVDRHVARGFGEQVAIIHDSPVTDSISKITYRELQTQVGCSFLNVKLYLLQSKANTYSECAVRRT